MWISDKSITRIAKALNLEIFQLFVPYNAGKRELNASASSSLIELRQNILNDASLFCSNIDNRIKEILEVSADLHNEKEIKSKKANKEKLARVKQQRRL